MPIDNVRRVRSRTAGRAKKLDQGAQVEKSAGFLRDHADGRTSETLKQGATARVMQFVRGSHQLSITSQSLAELLGLMEAECRSALDGLVAAGQLRRVLQEPHPPLYCKE
jgi:hypothetical protein